MDLPAYKVSMQEMASICLLQRYTCSMIESDVVFYAGDLPDANIWDKVFHHWKLIHSTRSSTDMSESL